MLKLQFTSASVNLLWRVNPEAASVTLALRVKLQEFLIATWRQVCCSWPMPLSEMQNLCRLTYRHVYLERISVRTCRFALLQILAYCESATECGIETFRRTRVMQSYKTWNSIEYSLILIEGMNPRKQMNKWSTKNRLQLHDVCVFSSTAFYSASKSALLRQSVISALINFAAIQPPNFFVSSVPIGLLKWVLCHPAND